MTILLMLVIFISAIVVATSVKVIKEHERGALFTLGKYSGERPPGLHFVLPGIQQLKIIDVRGRSNELTPEDIERAARRSTTRDY